MANTQTLSVTQLKRALEIAENIQKLEGELAGILGNGAVAAPTGARRGRKPKALSAEAAPAPAKRGPKPGKAGKRVVSPEARARMAEAARKRWALRKGV